MEPEERCRRVMGGPEVDELRANDRGVGAGREGVVRGARCTAKQVKSKGRGPLFLSGYVDGKPFYLYKDGTTPTPSKVGRAAAEAGGRGAVHQEGLRGTAQQAGGRDVREGASLGRERRTGGDVAADHSRTTESPTAAPGGPPLGLAGQAYAGAARLGELEESGAWEGTSCWVEERRRLGAEVKAAVAQAAIRQKLWGLAEQPTAASGATRRKMAAYLARRGGLECQEDSGPVAIRLQLEEVTAAVVRLQGMMAEQQKRIDALEGEREMRTGEHGTVQWPALPRKGRRTPTSVRNLHDSFERAVSPPPPASSGAADLEWQVEELWSEVAAAQAAFAAALPTETMSGVQENPDRSDIENPDRAVCVGAEAMEAEAVPEATAEARAAGAATGAVGEAAATRVVGSPPVPPPAAQPPYGAMALVAVPAASEAALELTAEAAAAVAQAAAAIAGRMSSRLGRFFEETEEEFERRMREPGTIVETEYQELCRIFKMTAGPAETQAELAERWRGGIWKEARDSLERRAASLFARWDSEG